METFGKFCATILALAGVMLVYGAVLHCLWGWFIVPLGAPEIGVAHATGLSLFTTGLLGSQGRKAEEDEEFETIALKGIVRSLLLLFLSWLVYQFM